MSRPRLLLALAAVVVVATGCRASTATAVRFAPSGDHEVTVTLSLSGEARDALRRTPQLEAQIEAMALARFPGARRADTATEVRWTATTDPATVVAASDVVGVGSLEVTGGKHPRVVAGLVHPTSLEAAVDAEPDRAAVPALKENIWVGVAVEFPGGVDEVDAGGLPVRTTDRSVKVSQPLATLRPGTLSVTGSLAGDHTLRNAAVAAVAAVLAGMAAVVVLGRRRRQ